MLMHKFGYDYVQPKPGETGKLHGYGLLYILHKNGRHLRRYWKRC